MIYDVRLKVDDVDFAWAHSRGRICAVTMDPRIQVGEAYDFRRMHDGFVCTVACDESQWPKFQQASQEGCTLFAGEYPIIGPYVKEPDHGQNV